MGFKNNREWFIWNGLESKQLFIRITSAFQKPNDHLTRSDNLLRKFDLKKIFMDSESKWPRTVENSTGKVEHENYSKWN